MAKRRRIAIGTTAGGATLLALAGVAWWFWLPSLVRDRVEESAARRGLRATLGSVDLGLSDVVLEDLELHDDHGVLRVRAARASTDAGLLDLVLDGTRAVRELALHEVEVRIDLEAPRLREVLEQLRGAGNAEPASASSAGRALRVEGLSLDLIDRHGPLVRVRDAQASMDAQGIVRAATGPVEIAPAEDDGARVESLSARLVRGEDGLEIAALSVEGVALRYADRDGGDPSPLWARVRRHARRAAGSSDRTSAPDGASPSDESSELGALLASARAIVGPRLAADAILEVEELSVTAATARGPRMVLRDLEAEVRALEGGRFQLSGSGRPGRGGRMGWRLTVDPDELRAEGRLDFQRLPFVLVAPFLPDLPWHRPEDARLSGELSIEGRGASQVHLDGELSVDELALSSPRIAPQPVRRISLGLAGQADWNPVTRRLDLLSATISAGEARVALAGSVEWPEDHYLIDVRATLPPTDCDGAVAAIPADLLAELGAFSFSGQIGGRVVAHVDSRDLEATTLTIDIADGCRFETAPGLADVRRFEGPFRHRVVEPEGPPFEMETGPGTANWVPIRDVSPFFVHAVLGHEDGGFFRHHGFSTGSIEQALVRNLRTGRYAYGASTITMQLVKNVFLHREKTLARKVQEVLLTWWVESVMSKERILELYLNVIEYGPGVYGIRNAAEHYFGCTPGDLDPAQAAYLASILPNPKAYHSYWVEDAVPERFARRVARFLETLGARDRFDSEAVAYGLERLATLDFYHPGEPRPGEPAHRGRAAPLPFGESLDRQWEEAIGPEATSFEEPEEF